VSFGKYRKEVLQLNIKGKSNSEKLKKLGGAWEDDDDDEEERKQGKKPRNKNHRRENQKGKEVLLMVDNPRKKKPEEKPAKPTPVAPPPPPEKPVAPPPTTPTLEAPVAVAGEIPPKGPPPGWVQPPGNWYRLWPGGPHNPNYKPPQKTPKSGPPQRPEPPEAQRAGQPPPQQPVAAGRNGNGMWKWLAIGAVIALFIIVIALVFKPAPTPQTPQPALQTGQPAPTPVTPPPAPTFSNYVTGAEVHALLQRTFPTASVEAHNSSYRLYAVRDFADFMRQEYQSGNYNRFVTRTASYTRYDACGAAAQLVANANARLPDIPIGMATLNDQSRTYLIVVFRGDSGLSGLEVLSFAPLDGRGLPNDTRMQKVEIR